MPRFAEPMVPNSRLLVRFRVRLKKRNKESDSDDSSSKSSSLSSSSAIKGNDTSKSKTAADCREQLRKRCMDDYRKIMETIEASENFLRRAKEGSGSAFAGEKDFLTSRASLSASSQQSRSLSAELNLLNGKPTRSKRKKLMALGANSSRRLKKRSPIRGDSAKLVKAPRKPRADPPSSILVANSDDPTKKHREYFAVPWNLSDKGSGSSRNSTRSSPLDMSERDSVASATVTATSKGTTNTTSCVCSRATLKNSRSSASCCCCCAAKPCCYRDSSTSGLCSASTKSAFSSHTDGESASRKLKSPLKKNANRGVRSQPARKNSPKKSFTEVTEVTQKEIAIEVQTLTSSPNTRSPSTNGISDSELSKSSVTTGSSITSGSTTASGTAGSNSSSTSGSSLETSTTSVSNNLSPSSAPSTEAPKPALSPAEQQELSSLSVATASLISNDMSAVSTALRPDDPPKKEKK